MYATSANARTFPINIPGLHTLQAEQDRALQNGKEITSDVVVHVGAGTYYQREALVLTGLDAGRGGRRMRYVGVDRTGVVSNPASKCIC